MSLFKLAWQNFTQHAKRYGALVLSLSFTVFVYFNFENLQYSETLAGLSPDNLDKVKMLLDIVKVVLVCFMVSFIWYASNVFLKSQKKEIGIYVFLGLTTSRIGLLYAIENTLVGLVSIGLGVAVGSLFSYLFAMIFVQVSQLGVAVEFSLSGRAVFETAFLFFLIYGLLTGKGVWDIQRSSVRELMSASRQYEKIEGGRRFLLAKALVGCVTLGIGYAFAIKNGGWDVLANAMIATVCVILGTYWLFGGFLPLVLQTLQKKQTVPVRPPAGAMDQRSRLSHETKLSFLRDGVYPAHLRRDGAWVRFHAQQPDRRDAAVLNAVRLPDPEHARRPEGAF